MFMFNGEYMMGMEKIRSMLLNWSIGHNFKDKYLTGTRGRFPNYIFQFDKNDPAFLVC